MPPASFRQPRAIARTAMARDVRPELLDALPATDPRALRSRGDLRRINLAMGNARLLGRQLDAVLATGGAVTGNAPRERVQVVELGAGDGTLLPRLARARAHRWPPLRVTFLDLQPVVDAATLDACRALGWEVEVVRADAFDWLAHAPAARRVLVANLFLHHFAAHRLRALLSVAARAADALVAVEPRRSRLALLGSRSVWLLGANDVTRHDAVASVHAGFAARELSEAWPHDRAWRLEEHPAGLFSHCFSAVRAPFRQDATP
jgi:SAM-dependent methyltransferase